MTLAVETQERFQHEALVYRGDHDFVRKVGAFIRESIDAEEPILVVVAAYKIDLLRQELGSDAERVRFADMTEIGRNPARILPAWRDFVDEQSSSSLGRFRGVGEPIWAERTPDQLAECQGHDGLLNVAFGGLPAWWLVCPYDAETLHQDVIDNAYRTHPVITNGDGTHASAAFLGADSRSRPFADPLPEPDKVDEEFGVDINLLDSARRRVAARAAKFRMTPDRIRDLMLAVSEVVTNSLRYGGGRGRARLWTRGDDLCFEIRDAGCIDVALAGCIRPTPGQLRGYGLWLANQVCDLVQIRTLPSGSVVRLHMSRTR